MGYPPSSGASQGRHTAAALFPLALAALLLLVARGAGAQTAVPVVVSGRTYRLAAYPTGSNYRTNNNYVQLRRWV